jgi:hypothetical protein
MGFILANDGLLLVLGTANALRRYSLTRLCPFRRRATWVHEACDACPQCITLLRRALRSGVFDTVCEYL